MFCIWRGSSEQLLICERSFKGIYKKVFHETPQLILLWWPAFMRLFHGFKPLCDLSFILCISFLHLAIRIVLKVGLRKNFSFSGQMLKITLYCAQHLLTRLALTCASVDNGLMILMLEVSRSIRNASSIAKQLIQFLESISFCYAKMEVCKIKIDFPVRKSCLWQNFHFGFSL